MKNLSSNQATKLYKMDTPNYWSDNEAEAEAYSDMERYGFISDTTLRLSKAIADKLVVPVGSYVVKKIAVEMKDLTTELMKGLTEQIKEAVKQEIDVMQNKIKALPSEIIEGVKSSISIKLPWGAPTMETSDDGYDSYTYTPHYSGLEI